MGNLWCCKKDDDDFNEQIKTHPIIRDDVKEEVYITKLPANYKCNCPCHKLERLKK